MDFAHSVKAKNPATEKYLEDLTKDTTYIKNGVVYRRDPESGKTVEALGPVSEVTPDKCKGCLFWASKPGKHFTSDGEVMFRGCIRQEYGCIDRPIDQRILTKTGVSPHAVSDKGKKMLKSMWSNKQK